MISEERRIYPTWKSLGHISQVVDEVNVDVRIVGEYDPNLRMGGWRSGWQPSDDWPPSLIWGMFNILQRFLKYGPAFDTLEPAEDAIHLRSVWDNSEVLRLKTLVLNVVTPSEEEMKGKSFVEFEESSLSHRTNGAKRKGVMRPETIVLHLLTYVPHMLQRDGYAAPYAEEIYKKVGRIRLCLDGLEKGAWVVKQLEEEAGAD